MDDGKHYVQMSLDLEMNQPSGKIIQIGVTVGDEKTGAVYARAAWYVKIDEPLNPYITDLTGITEEDLATKGVTLLEAYRAVEKLHKEWNCAPNPIVWGGGDSRELRDQLGLTSSDSYVFGHRWIDVKTLFQSWRRAMGQPVQGGLAKSMTKVGLKFEGRKHDAGDDSFNTFRMYCTMQKKWRA